MRKYAKPNPEEQKTQPEVEENQNMIQISMSWYIFKILKVNKGV